MGVSQVRALFEQGDLQAALDHIDEIGDHYRADHPEFFEFKLMNARILLELGQYERGERLLNSLLDLGRKGGMLVRIDMVILLSDILWRKGNWDQAFFMIEMGEYDFTKLGSKLPEREKDKRYAELKRLKGIYYRYSGELDLAVEYFQECLFTAENTGDKRLLAKIYNLLGLVYHETGELSKSWAFYLKSYEMHQLFEDDRGVAISQFNLAGLQEYIGDMEQARENYEQSLNISRRSSNVRLEGNALCSLGILIMKLGDFHEGIQLVNAGLTIKGNLGNDIDTSWTFYKLLNFLIYSGYKRYVAIYLDEMEEIYQRNMQNSLINQHYKLIQASLLQKADKTIERAKAQKIFKEITEESVIDLTLTLHAIISLSHMLLEELKISPVPEIVDEIVAHIDKLEAIANEQYSLVLIIEISIIKAKFAFLAQDYQFSLQKMSSALELIEKKGFYFLEEKAQEVYNYVLEKIENINALTSNTDLSRIVLVEESEVDDRVASTINKQIYSEKAKGKGKLFIISDDKKEIQMKIALSDQDVPDEHLISQMLSALNSILTNTTEKNNPIERIKHGKYHIISKHLGNFFVHYIYEGESSITEIHKVDKMIENLQNLYELNEMEDIQHIDPELILELLS